MPPHDNVSRLIPHNRITFGEEEVRAVTEVIESGHWIAGRRTARLEEALRAQAGVRYAVCVSSGLSALRLALKGLGVGVGHEVIVPAYSCVALANAVLALGATPVPVDVQKETWIIDPSSVRAHISQRTKAIVAVHMYGFPAPIAELRSFNIPIIEDCAHAFGKTLDGERIGSMGDAAILSFYATKLIGAGKGGAVLTANNTVADVVRAYRYYCDQPMDAQKQNDVMTDISAAIALCQLARLPNMIEARKRIALQYHRILLPLAEKTRCCSLPDTSSDRIWYRYAIAMSSVTAQKVIDALRRHGVHAERPAEDWREGEAKNLPEASLAYERLVSLPCYPTLSEEEQDAVCVALKTVIQSIASIRGS